jgi:hypothetical protein
MAYADKFDREIELVDMTEAQELAVKVVMKGGELKFRDALIGALETELAEEEKSLNPDWVDGVRYCIKLVREGDFNVNE